MRSFLVATSALMLCASSAHAQSEKMNFFITSAGPGQGGDLGGIEGADRHCSTLAYRAGAGDLTWRAYLSLPAIDGRPAVHARDRIGTGPFYNSRGDLIAQTVAELHSDSAKLGKQTSVNEKGELVNGRGDTPNTHDIITGSQPDGTAYPPGTDTTCNRYTSSGEGAVRLGHHDRQGGGEFPASWNSAHLSRGCSQQNLVATGGNGLFYCFGTR
jgi:hypothetical protein